MGCCEVALPDNGRANVEPGDLALNIWSVLNGHVFIHCLHLPRFLGAGARADTMGM